MTEYDPNINYPQTGENKTRTEDERLEFLGKAVGVFILLTTLVSYFLMSGNVF